MKYIPSIDTITTIDKNGNKVIKGGLWRDEQTGKIYLETLKGEWIEIRKSNTGSK